MKILKDIYCKLNDVNKKEVDNGRKNDKLYPFFESDYPPLMTSVNNILRNDAGHLNYDEREKYTTEELMEASIILIAGVSTAIIANTNMIIDLFKDSMDLLNLT